MPLKELTDEKLIVDRSVLCLYPSHEGKQHDETRSLAFRLAGKSGRDPVEGATLHLTVEKRFSLPSVLQYDVFAPYRPEALRAHQKFANLYANVPLPHTTCWQQIKAARKIRKEENRRKARERIQAKNIGGGGKV